MKGNVMRFNELLLRTRLEHNVSIEELSKEVAASEFTIKKYEDGTVLPDVVTLVRICRALNVTPNDLLLDVTFSPKSNEFRWPRENFLRKRGEYPIDLREKTQEEKIQFAKTRQKNAYEAVVQGLRLHGLTYAEAEELMEKVKDME